MEMRQNPLVAEINLAAESLKVPRFIVPATEVLAEDTLRTNRLAKEYRRESREAKPRAGLVEERGGAQLDKLRQKASRLRKLLGNALPLERETVKESLSGVQGAIKRKIKEIKSEQSKVIAPKLSADRLERVLKHRERGIGKILARYPNAQIVDLSCLAVFRGPEGLPALALYNLQSPVCSISASADLVNLKPSVELSRADQKSLAEIVQIATGARLQSFGPPDNFSGHRDRFFSGFGRLPNSTELIKEAKEAGFWKGEPKKDELPASAIRITIESQFGEGGRVIPESSRRIIRKAVESKLFDDVLLLAETKKWEVTYHDLLGGSKAFIKGKVTTTPRTRDPLVLGMKKIGNRTYAMLIHDFNTTKLERHVKDEWASKPDEVTK